MNWSFAASITVAIAAVAAWGLAGWLGWTQWNRSGRQKRVLQLELLRFFIVGLLAFTLLRPEIVWSARRQDKPIVAILADRSDSMRTTDVVVSNTPITRAEWTRQQVDRAPWRSFEPDARVVVTDFAPRPTNAPPQLMVAGDTDLASPIDAALQQHPSLKAIILLTDGDWNVGPSPVTAAIRSREKGIPLFAVAVGNDQAAPDVILEQVSPPSYGLFGEQISIPFKIVNHLPQSLNTTAILLEGDREETRKAIQLPAGGELQDAIVWSPRAVGDRTLTLSIPVEPGEGVPENNVRQFNINIRVEKLKVLVVDSLPRWEYRFLRNALARDPGVELHCVLLHPGLGAGGGRDYLPEFPGSKEALARYDVVFLGDVGFDGTELMPDHAALLRGLVEQQASGLVFLPGRRGRHLTWLDSPLADLLPVVLDRSKPNGNYLQNESTLSLSSLGRRHWLTRFDAVEERNEEIWRHLPGFFWSAAVEKSRPGSEVLGVHSAMRNPWGRLPLLVIRSAGSGKVLFLGTDSAWRWRRGVEDLYHYRFWSQVVRWMAHQRHLAGEQGIRLSFLPESPQLGDVLYLQAAVLDASGQPAASGPVIGKVTMPKGRSERIDFEPVPGGWGVFRASITAGEAGLHTFEIASEPNGRQLTTTVDVLAPVRERLGQPANLGILREITSLTRGAVSSPAKFDELLRQVSLLPEPKPAEVRLKLWSHPAWGGFLILLWTIYWTGRKLAGMI